MRLPVTVDLKPEPGSQTVCLKRTSILASMMRPRSWVHPNGGACHLLHILLLTLACHSATVAAVINDGSALDPRWFESETFHHPSTHREWDHKLELHGSIQPTYHCPRTKRALRSSSLDDEVIEGHLLKNAHGRHREELTIQYGMRGESMTLDLTLNENLIPGGYSFLHQTPDGRDILEQLDRQDVELCHYEGTVRERPGSRVALSTCGGAIEGVIYERNETYLIEYHNNTHLLYRTRHKRELLLEDPAVSGTAVGNNVAKVAFTAGYRENADSLFVELALVVDRTLFLKFGSNVQRIHQHCLSVANVLNELYRPLNIYIALVGVVLWNTRDNIVISTDSKQTLTSFLAYRRDQLLRQIPNDNAHLLTAVRFPDGVIGKAELGSMCTAAGSGGIAVVENFIVTPLATTIAHELGHNFNIDHDSEECGGVRCPGPGPCIMEAKLRDTSDIPNRWSTCSVEDLEESLKRGLGACLRNKPARMLVRAVCGNGLLEPGEQCDCGRRDSCDNACCDARTCQLRANATCAMGACCDLATCQPKPAGAVCRQATGECDLPEYCDGRTELCPRDVYLRDTSPCRKGEAYCYQGACHTRDSQCQVLWGPTARSGPEVCYETNANGTVFGNCGNELATDRYERCEGHDLACGLLHCTHRNEKLEYGVEAYAKRTATKYQHYGPRGTVRTTVCNAVIVDLGPDVTNPGLAPDGTKCGTGRMCFRQRCVAISRLQEERDIGDECPYGCSGNGVCNSEGHCHCLPGFAPPFCDGPGEGGSIDSGPVGRSALTTHDLLLLVFVPSMIIAGVLVTVSVILLIAKRALVMAHLRTVLKRFRERKYGNIVAPPATGGATERRPAPTVSPPPPPPPIPGPPKEPQCFINISKDGKVTIENKLYDSPFLHKTSVVDRHEAFRMRLLQERSYSVESTASSEHPLVTAETHEPRREERLGESEETPENRTFGSVLQELQQADRKRTFQNHRSKSDERPAARQLPKLTRQRTVGDFDSIERLPEADEDEPISKPATPKPAAIPRPLPRVALGATSRQLPATPGSGTTRGATSGANVAALKAKLNLAEIGARR
ncbi:disintegrin and metalloproteinase domain-containing protein 12-like [Anopheles nili]|uniref:disintegrin and metalloproteinase domain-containing protein 12-like n=1 Tax=Anopheles nili TaxID=185578 RepID=UPI00237BD819|nr:disintegrin and metalloproteinase domain-containing protein 12-like [Anopheles nili]